MKPYKETVYPQIIFNVCILEIYTNPCISISINKKEDVTQSIRLFDLKFFFNVLQCAIVHKRRPRFSFHFLYTRTHPTLRVL